MKLTTINDCWKLLCDLCGSESPERLGCNRDQLRRLLHAADVRYEDAEPAVRKLARLLLDPEREGG